MKSPTLKAALFAIIVPVSAFTQTVVAWGDSLTHPLGWPSQFAALSGGSVTVISRGIGGNTSTQVKDRFISEPALHDAFTVIWAGRNNYWDAATVKADIAAMIETLDHSNYLVLGITNGNYAGEYIGQSGHTLIGNLNAELAAIYPGSFIDIREVLIAAYNPSIAQDVIDFGRDIVPFSLRGDNLHLNAAGLAIVAASVYAGYLSSVPEPSTFALVMGLIAAALLALRRHRYV